MLSWRRVKRFCVRKMHEDPESCNPEGRQVVSGEPVGHENLLVRDNATGITSLSTSRHGG